jgi:MFS family permease
VAPPKPLVLVVLLGVVSLFADMTYEGARSITGPYLAMLGASAAAVGVVAGFGEFLGYALRLASGYWADRTRRYWAITIFGYAVNLLAVPALALAGHWTYAAILIILERAGKAIRTPARDAMLSHATLQMGRGWGFGLHEALDQVGATLGPLIVGAVLYFQGGYRTAFVFLALPALLALGTLIVARRLYPRPQSLEALAPALRPKGFGGAYWLYLAAASCVALGYADYPLIAFHFERAGSVPSEWIPAFYAVAMAVDGLAALAFGYWYDRLGVIVLVAACAVSALFAPLAFLGGFHAALAAAILWGLGMGAQESVMRAAVAAMSAPERRGTAYGLFNTGFGLFWFLGSALMGLLYDFSLPLLVAFSVVAQLCALPLFVASHRSAGK